MFAIVVWFQRCVMSIWMPCSFACLGRGGWREEQCARLFLAVAFPWVLPVLLGIVDTSAVFWLRWD